MDLLFSAEIQFNGLLENKKSRIYGTSDQSDPSIYLSALLKSASNVRTFEADSLYIWGRFSIHLRPILCTFEADSLYIWGWFSIHLRPILYTFEANSLYIWGPIWANQTAVHLRQNLSDWLRHITWQNKLSLPQMYGIGLKCIENRSQMYRYCSLIGSDSENRPQMYRILTFDSNSTSDISYQMC